MKYQTKNNPFDEFPDHQNQGKNDFDGSVILVDDYSPTKKSTSFPYSLPL